MIDLQEYLENKLRDIICSWNAEDIYAISFFVYANDSIEYRGCSNVTEFFVSYNTENDCQGADEFSEERWNYAFWRQKETPIFEASDECPDMKILFDWYEENGIDRIGYEDVKACYDNEMRYIGKGPIGLYELLSEITSVALRLEESGFIKTQFGRPIPIIIHDLEYSWYMIDATRKANANGEADAFFFTMKSLGFTE